MSGERQVEVLFTETAIAERTMALACVASNRLVPIGVRRNGWGPFSPAIGLKLSPSSGLKFSGSFHDRKRSTMCLI